MWLMKMASMAPARTLLRRICCCVPSPQSNSSARPSITSATAARFRSRDGVPALVPRKTRRTWFIMTAKEVRRMLRKVTTISLIVVFSLVADIAFADGAATYKAKCALCHGANGAGDTPSGKSMKVRDLRSDVVQKQTDIELTKTISGGKGKMPPYGKQLSNADIAAVIAFIRTLKAK